MKLIEGNGRVPFSVLDASAAELETTVYHARMSPRD